MKEGETGETGEVADLESGATKRKAGMCVGLVGVDDGLATRRGECVLVCGREKFVIVSSLGVSVKTVEFE